MKYSISEAVKQKFDEVVIKGEHSKSDIEDLFWDAFSFCFNYDYDPEDKSYGYEESSEVYDVSNIRIVKDDETVKTVFDIGFYCESEFYIDLEDDEEAEEMAEKFWDAVAFDYFNNVEVETWNWQHLEYEHHDYYEEEEYGD